MRQQETSPNKILEKKQEKAWRARIASYLCPAIRNRSVEQLVARWAQVIVTGLNPLKYGYKT
jgi:hypothetical protein